MWIDWLIGLHCRVISDLIEVLKKTEEIDSISKRLMSMRMDILSTFCYIFRNNESTKKSFRTMGGFHWAMSVIAAIGDLLERSTFFVIVTHTHSLSP